MLGTPAAEQEINDELVRTLLREQFPDLAGAPLVLLGAGWDNVMFRLGEELLVRLPRRKKAVALIEHEQTWLPVLAGRLPLPAPAPVRNGRPSRAYPWPWSILPWLPGRTADLEPPALEQARPWAEFLRALHQPAPRFAPPNPVRGVPLRMRSEMTEERLLRLRKTTESITPTIQNLWRQALAAPPADEACWLHGDLHARNVLVEGGSITGVIDWGDITSGDVATDLASAWMLFSEVEARQRCLQGYRPSAATLARAKGWAVLLGAVLLDTGLVDHPAHAAMGAAVLKRLDEEGDLV